jgi:hypothetical protein
MERLNLLKQLEYLIAFQSDCLAKGDWESFDKTENEIKKLEKAILKEQEKKAPNKAQNSMFHKKPNCFTKT